MSQKKTRATSLEEMQKRLDLMFRKEEIVKGFGLQLKSSDIVITPFAKCGTTWLQQIVHTLRTGGDMDFDDISRVVPWIETSAGLGLDINAEQRSNPRAFKSHLPYQAIPKGGKYINSIRNPGDALCSFYNFMEGWFLEPGAVGLDEFARQRFIQSRDYWRHLKSWWQHKDDPNVLFLVYENMLRDPTKTISRIAEFIEVPLDDELLELTLKNSSIEFMLENVNRFDDAMIRKVSEKRCNLPSGSSTAKVHQGKSGAHKQVLSVDIINELDEVWQKEIFESLGYRNYETLSAAVS
ncbi:MAG: sulfotransferase domain-containing protein [Pseudomonadales bacterium]|nr:sulfotransferase domain-containing protein [Pseudomonadales bacterium]